MPPESTQKPEESSLISEYEWIIRPCQMYLDEYQDCTSIKARFNQYFIYGKLIDCTQWKRDTDNCEKWIDKKDIKAAHELIESELARRKVRLDAHYSNDTWERRNSPPEKWNEPLPDYISKDYDESYLGIKAREMRGEKVDLDPMKNQTTCVIM